MQRDHVEHPGKHVLELCLAPLGLSVTEAATALGVARNTLSRLIHGHHGISPDMAVRLSIAFGGSPEMWLKYQIDYDLARAKANIDADSVKIFATNSGLRKDVVRISHLDEPRSHDDLEQTTAAERIGLMWPLAQDAWTFKGDPHPQSRLSRHTVHIFQRES